MKTLCYCNSKQQCTTLTFKQCRFHIRMPIKIDGCLGELNHVGMSLYYATSYLVLIISRGSGKSDTLHPPDHFIAVGQAFLMTLSLPFDLPGTRSSGGSHFGEPCNKEKSMAVLCHVHAPAYMGRWSLPGH